MSTLNASNFVAGNAKLTSGGVKLPAYAANSKPSSSEVGTLILNQDTAKIELWNGTSGVVIGGGVLLSYA